MKRVVDTTKVVFVTVLLGGALVGCNRPALDKAAKTSADGTPPGTSVAPSAPAPSAASAIDDSIITTKVKTALLADADIKGSDINVETSQGEVLLSGFVKTEAQVDKAVKVAGTVEGVKKVTEKTVVKQ